MGQWKRRRKNKPALELHTTNASRHTFAQAAVPQALNKACGNSLHRFIFIKK